MTTNTPNNLVGKIQKLLAMSKSSNPNEAALALQHAQRLAVQHGFDLAVVAQTETVAEEVIEQKGIAAGKRKSVAQKFISWLLNSHFKVQVINSGSRYCGQSIILVGRTSDVQIAEYVQGFLNREFMNLWHRARQTNPQLQTKDRNSFIYGLYKGLDAKLNESKAAAEQEQVQALAITQGNEYANNVSNTYALALVDQTKQLNQAVEKFFPRLRHTTTTAGRIRNYSAMQDGVNQGRKINLSPALGNSSTKALR